MNFQRSPRFWLMLGVAAVALLILQQFWHWEVSRVEVPAGKFLVRIHRWGQNLAPDQILAPDDSYKGVMREPLPEGRHFLNPIFWSYEIHDMVTVPPGQCLVLTRKFGKPIPKERLAAGDIFARGEDECGILEEVMTQGSYRLNRYAYDWRLEAAVEVRPGQVGVRTLKVGKDPRRLPAAEGRGRYVVPAGDRGVQKDPVKSGTHYINPFAETITPVEVQNHRVELTDIQFPSRDGFILKPHVLVGYAVQPAKAAELLVRLSDQGKLHQEDATEEQKKGNEILQKIILPHIRGAVRIEGSNLDAKDFIVTKAGAGDEKVVNNREQFQRTLLAKVKPQCEEIGIDVFEVTLAGMDLPPELLDQISARDVARQQQATNKSQLEQLKTKQKFKAAEALKQQAKEKVDAETRLSQGKILAAKKKENEELRLKNELENARLKLEAGREKAKSVLALGKAEADIINMQNEAEVAGLRRAVQGFASADHFAQYHILSKVAPALTEIFASDNSDFAKLFSTYMTQPTSGNNKTTNSPPVKSASGSLNGSR